MGRLVLWLGFAGGITLVGQTAGDEELRTFLRSELGQDDPEFGGEPTRYFDAHVDLNGDGRQEVIVYVMGRRWCGAGGCNLLVLTPSGSSWRVLVHATITRPPVRVLDRSMNGWRSIAVWFQSGGVQPGFEEEFDFDGASYASQSSVAGVGPAPRETPGRVVIAERPLREGRLLH